MIVMESNIYSTMNIDSQKDFLGFTDMNDFLTSLFSPKTFLVQLGGVGIASITTFLTDYVWNSAEAIYLLWILMLVDWFTGLTYAIKSKTYWSRKNFRMPIYFICTSFLIGVSWWLSKFSIAFTYLPAIVYGGFCAVYLSSWVENMGKLEWIPEPIAKVVAKRFGLKELLKKFDRAEKKKEEKEPKGH